jgi:hypothetical protein
MFTRTRPSPASPPLAHPYDAFANAHAYPFGTAAKSAARVRRNVLSRFSRPPSYLHSPSLLFIASALFLSLCLFFPSTLFSFRSPHSAPALRCAHIVQRHLFFCFSFSFRHPAVTPPYVTSRPKIAFSRRVARDTHPHPHPPARPPHCTLTARRGDKRASPVAFAIQTDGSPYGVGWMQPVLWSIFLWHPAASRYIPHIPLYPAVSRCIPLYPTRSPISTHIPPYPGTIYNEKYTPEYG